MCEPIRYLSLFSGMEAAHLAWAPLGWECVGVAEIEPSACALLAHRLPHVPNLGSVTEITAEQIAALGHIDVVIGGSPCQDLSVAGKRKGLAGARSGLFHEQLRIFHAARTLCGARWLVWENVPGAFSSNRGRDFAVVAGALAGCELDVPRDGWGNEGVALGPNGLVEWSVLDAQWFGVAQRRRRVFAVLDTGNWADRPPVLLERDSLRGDSAPRREAGEGVAASACLSVALRGREGGGTAELGDDVSGTLRASSGGGGGDKPYVMLPETVGTLCADSHPGAYTGQDAYTGRLIPTFVMAHGQGGAEVVAGERRTTLTCNHEAPILVQEVAHILRADGFDASEDGTGRGTPLVPCYAIQAGALRTNPESGPDGVGVQEEHAYTLEARAEVQCVAFDCNAGGDKPHILTGMQVRRLTPRECERLQGAFDDWTLVPNAKGKPMADGPRYKMLGNSFAVPVIRWIGRRIQIAHTWLQRAAA